MIAMHGTPGGRITYWDDPTIYARHGLRRLTYDRPETTKRLRGVPRPDGSRMDELRRRLRLAYIEGAEGWSRETLGCRHVT